MRSDEAGLAVDAQTGGGAIEPQTVLESSAERTHAQYNRAMLLRTLIAIGLLAGIAAAINAFSHGAFVTAGNLTNVLRQITYNAILAIGQTFVIITAGIDLSVGSLIELTGVVMAMFANALPFHWGPLVFVLTLLVGLCVGAFAGFVNAVPVVRFNLPPFITTLAMMLMARGLAFKLAGGHPITLVDSTAVRCDRHRLSIRSAPTTARVSRCSGAGHLDGGARRRLCDRADAHALRPLRLCHRR